MPYAIAHYFGRSCFSSILGWTTMVTVFCGSIGGIFGGLIYDNYQNYHMAWIVCAVFWALAIMMVFALGRKPVKRGQSGVIASAAT